MGRRLSRDVAMKLLYQIDISKEHSDNKIEKELSEYRHLDENDKTYIHDVINGVLNNKEFIDSLIKSYLKNWEISRLPKIDLCILRLSTYEINFRKDIPHNAAVNEAIELSKKYSTDESGSFINGILGKIVDFVTKKCDNDEQSNQLKQ